MIGRTQHTDTVYIVIWEANSTSQKYEWTDDELKYKQDDG
jgi:hypothetical protein